MKIYLKQTVLEAAKDRIRWLFREFPNVYVNFSGGKDSTVVMNLTLEVAAEMGRLPVNVMFIDQEAEWAHVIEYMRRVMSDPRVRAHWLQVPIKLFNATSMDAPWLLCWDPAARDVWMREQEPNSIRENVFGTDRFSALFGAYLKHHHPDEKAVSIAGVRCEESPARRLGLTIYETYGGETWGKKEDERRGHYAFYPIYDWSWQDVWKAIHEHGWDYCKIYDYQYQYGVPVRDMRVSNLHHETAVKNLFTLQEIERDTFDRLTQRIGGIRTAAQMEWDFYGPRNLPPMFADWREYRDHLLENLVPDEAQREVFRRQFAQYENNYDGKALRDLHRTEIACILVNDYHGTKLTTFVASHMLVAKNRGKKSGRDYSGELERANG